MQRVAVALAAVVLVGTQIVSADANDVRAENREILLAWEGEAFDPGAAVRVVSGPSHALLDQLLSGETALELHLDHLAAHGVRLADLQAPSSSGTPAWPLEGKIQFHEKGWFQMGARCPEVSPEQEPTIEDLFDTALPGQDDRLGLMTTRVSEFDRNDRGSQVQSAIQYWTADQDASSEAPAQTFWYTGWTVEVGFMVDYFCREPAASQGIVFHDSFVTPHADRTDD